MYKAWVFLHMIGLAIGAGTGVFLASVGRYAEKNLDTAEARTLMPGINGAISRVGKTGFALLLLSGLVMLVSNGTFNINPMFQIKMGLVLLIVLYIGFMEIQVRKLAKTGDRVIAMRIKKWGILGPVLAFMAILSAVLAFN